MSSAFEMPQIMTLCGIQPEQTDIDFSYRRLDAADAKLLAFDLSKNRTVKTVKYAAARKRSLLCQRPMTPVPASPVRAGCEAMRLAPKEEQRSQRGSRAT